MLYGTDEKIPIKKCIEYELLLILFSLLFIISIFLGVTNNVLGMLVILPAILYPVFILKAKKGKAIEGFFCILHHGIFGVCFSFLFALSGMEIVLYLFQGKERVFILCIAGAGYILSALSWFCLMRIAIKKMDSSKTKKVNGSIPFAIFGVLGIIVAKVILKDMDQEKGMKLLCVICFFLSYLCVCSIFLIYKFLYLVKHKM